MKIIDSHTHDPERPMSVINWKPGMPFNEAFYYSAATHPWDAGSPRKLDRLPESPRIVAVGETGIDKLKGPAIDVQMRELLKWIDVSESHSLPLILHVVKAFPEIISLKKELSPAQPWIIHGFRGKPELAKELLRHGFFLSLGERHNPETATIIPPDRLLLESDEGTGIPKIKNADPALADKIFLGSRL